MTSHCIPVLHVPVIINVASFYLYLYSLKPGPLWCVCREDSRNW